MNSKKIRSLLIIVGILLMSIPFDYSLPNNSVPDNETGLKPKPSNGAQLTLLHSYDFEDNTVGEDPFGTTLWVKFKHTYNLNENLTTPDNDLNNIKQRMENDDILQIYPKIIKEIIEKKRI